MSEIEFVERLSLHEKFRLIEIAHETRDQEIRRAALDIILQSLYPPVQVSGLNEKIRE